MFSLDLTESFVTKAPWWSQMALAPVIFCGWAKVVLLFLAAWTWFNTSRGLRCPGWGLNEYKWG